MVVGRLRCLSCFFTCSSMILFWVCLHDVEASSCQGFIHKKVGDTVELPSCSQTEGITTAQWRYGGVKIADKDNIVQTKFSGRLTLNPTNFSLTVRALTVQDSGEFSFVSEKNEMQQPTVIIALTVQEPITEKPVLTSNTWHTSNSSCTVVLECSVTGNVAYSWTVRNQTRSGSRLQDTITEQDGDTEFTCTVSNFISKMSASTSVKCSTMTREGSPGDKVILLAGIGGGCLLVVIVLVIVVAACYCKRSHNGSDTNELTVYADITEVEGHNSSTMKPCSVYETINDRVSSVTPGPLTVYDKIQLNRARKTSVSPYQDIS